MKKAILIFAMLITLSACGTHQRWVWSPDPGRDVLEPPCPAFDMYQLNNQGVCQPVVMRTQPVRAFSVKPGLRHVLNAPRRMFPAYDADWRNGTRP